MDWKVTTSKRTRWVEIGIQKYEVINAKILPKRRILTKTIDEVKWMSHMRTQYLHTFAKLWKIYQLVF